ncbi:MAG: DNA-3-methyladenine glycosylase I [Bdellovibrionales bacterium]|nr:DNA-3-methyladenine glycosylase I [Bdellovibrionales bacterium]
MKEKKRCPWVKLSNPTYVDYHDTEWGYASYDDNHHFEHLILEGAQSGLSWETVLMKRENYRKYFKNFDPQKVAKISKKEIETMLKDPGIIRNRQKVESAVNNAKRFLEVQKEFGTFSKYIWSFVNGKVIVNSPKKLKDYKPKSTISDELSKDLKKRGFKFVGSTTIYAHLQATGLINEHSSSCYLSGKKLLRK